MIHLENFYNWLNSLFPLMERGGWVMWPIVILSMLALAIILERTWMLLLMSSRIAPSSFLKELMSLLDRGRLEAAVVACRKNDSIMARILLSGLSLHGEPRAVIREALEDAGRRESRELERYLGVLAAIAGVSPLLGLLGTVMGMIEIFNKIALEHIGQFEHLAGGIYVALYTTAAGLIVAIPAYLAFRSFSGLAERKIQEMEDWALELLERLERASPENAEPASETGAGQPS